MHTSLHPANKHTTVDVRTILRARGPNNPSWRRGFTCPGSPLAQLGYECTNEPYDRRRAQFGYIFIMPYVKVFHNSVTTTIHPHTYLDQRAEHGCGKGDNQSRSRGVEDIKHTLRDQRQRCHQRPVGAPCRRQQPTQVVLLDTRDG